MLRVAFQHERWRILLYRRLLSTTRSPYQVLGVPSGATKADVKKAYIEKAKKCHPDLFPDDEEKTKEFQELQEAYTILSDTKKRAEYAQMQRATQGQGPAGPRHPYTDYSGAYSRNSGAYGHSFRYGADGPGKKDPFHDMLQEMLRAQQQKHRKYGPEYAHEAKIRGSRWDQIILRLVLAYMVLWIFFGNLRFAASQQAPVADPDGRRATPLEDFMAARMRDNVGPVVMDPREREFLARQREVRELMEKYNEENKGKKKKKDETIDMIENDRSE